MWIWIRRLIGRKLTNTFQGEDGKATVGISQEDAMDARDKLLFDQLNLLQKAESEAKKALVSPFLKQVTKSSVNLWKSIRRLVFGMLDGSDLNEFGLVAQDNRVPVFARVSQVIHNPKDVFLLNEELKKELGIDSINWENLEVADSVLAANNEKLSKEKAALDSRLSRMIEIDTKIAEYQLIMTSGGTSPNGEANG